ncbi:OARD1-like protein [Mya arenaria]|uniref:OARD1-like protein n=1 Tax=Mya arenaria TaxID=6604 RepID=A0ABY7EIN9_MYAAR|nr:ADP-ribose glycohydrolase OARD1-like [Mya arenaria]WAR08676.1 OARD1-like protein [Mya arenaria]
MLRNKLLHNLLTHDITKYFKQMATVNVSSGSCGKDSSEMTTTDRKDELSDFKIMHKKGDLFACPSTDSLAHCVSKDLRMGKGIATLFKKIFGGVAELKHQAKEVGDVAVLKDESRFVYYLITKTKYNDKPTYKTLESSLEAMKKHCLANDVTAVSMPRIGCGLDLLKWPQVEDLLIQVFMDTDIKVTVYSI